MVEIPPDSPAQAAGLQPNDMILAIDGKPIADLTDKQVHALLAGEVGSRVALRVDRAGTIHELSVVRAPYRQGESTGHLRPQAAPPRGGP